MLWALGFLIALVVVSLGKVVTTLISKEIEGRLDQLTFALLRLARRRLPADLRDLHDREWLPEVRQLHEVEDARPLTKLCRGLSFAMKCYRRAGAASKANHRGVVLWWRLVAVLATAVVLATVLIGDSGGKVHFPIYSPYA